MKKGDTSFQRFSSGEVLFNEGDTSREMYIIRSGRVQVTIKKEDAEIPITELGKGSFVGEMSFIAGIPRTLVERIRRTTLMLSDYIAVGNVPALREERSQYSKQALTIFCDQNTIYCRGYFYKESIDVFKREIRKLIAEDQSITIDFTGIIDID